MCGILFAIRPMVISEFSPLQAQFCVFSKDENKDIQIKILKGITIRFGYMQLQFPNALCLVLAATPHSPLLSLWITPLCMVSAATYDSPFYVLEANPHPSLFSFGDHPHSLSLSFGGNLLQANSYYLCLVTAENPTPLIQFRRPPPLSKTPLVQTGFCKGVELKQKESSSLGNF